MASLLVNSVLQLGLEVVELGSRQVIVHGIQDCDEWVHLSAWIFRLDNFSFWERSRLLKARLFLRMLNNVMNALPFDLFNYLNCFP
jgi:hypothetical protein